MANKLEALNQNFTQRDSRVLSAAMEASGESPEAVQQAVYDAIVNKDSQMQLSVWRNNYLDSGAGGISGVSQVILFKATPSPLASSTSVSTQQQLALRYISNGLFSSRINYEATTWKGLNVLSGDDVTPSHVWGTTVCANHSWTLAYVTLTSYHLEDGKVWDDMIGQRVVLSNTPTMEVLFMGLSVNGAYAWVFARPTITANGAVTQTWIGSAAGTITFPDSEHAVTVRSANFFPKDYLTDNAVRQGSKPGSLSTQGLYCRGDISGLALWNKEPEGSQIMNPNYISVITGTSYQVFCIMLTPEIRARFNTSVAGIEFYYLSKADDSFLTRANVRFYTYFRTSPSDPNKWERVRYSILNVWQVPFPTDEEELLVVTTYATTPSLTIEEIQDYYISMHNYGDMSDVYFEPYDDIIPNQLSYSLATQLQLYTYHQNSTTSDIYEPQVFRVNDPVKVSVDGVSQVITGPEHLPVQGIGNNVSIDFGYKFFRSDVVWNMLDEKKRMLLPDDLNKIKDHYLYQTDNYRFTRSGIVTTTKFKMKSSSPITYMDNMCCQTNPLVGSVSASALLYYVPNYKPGTASWPDFTTPTTVAWSTSLPGLYFRADQHMDTTRPIHRVVTKSSTSNIAYLNATDIDFDGFDYVYHNNIVRSVATNAPLELRNNTGKIYLRGAHINSQWAVDNSITPTVGALNPGEYELNYRGFRVWTDLTLTSTSIRLWAFYLEFDDCLYIWADYSAAGADTISIASGAPLFNGCSFNTDKYLGARVEVLESHNAIVSTISMTNNWNINIQSNWVTGDTAYVELKLKAPKSLYTA